MTDLPTELQEEIFQKLYSAKINIPQAVYELGESANVENWEKMKMLFTEYCKTRKDTWG